MDSGTEEMDVRCSVHLNKVLHLYCTDCNKLVCLTCVTKQHQRHNFVEISDICEEKKQLLSNSLNRQINDLKKILDELKQHKVEYARKTKICEAEVKGQGEQIKMEVDRIVMDVLSDLQGRQLLYNTKVKDVEIETETALTDLQKMSEENKSKFDSKNCIHAILTADGTLEHLKTFQSYKPLDEKHLPSFDAARINRESLMQIFGFIKCENLMTSVDDTVEIKPSLNKTVSMAMPPPENSSEKHFDNRHLDNNNVNDTTSNTVTWNSNKGIYMKENVKVTGGKATDTNVKVIGSSNGSEREINIKDNVKVVDDVKQQSVKVTNNGTEIVSKFVHCRKVDHIAAVDNRCAWIAGSGYLDLVSTDGKILRSIKINFPVRGMAITKDGQLLLGTEGRIKKLLDSGEVTDFVKVGRFNANGIYVSDRNEVLVCLYKDDVGELIRRLTPQGQTIQTISHDKNGAQLFAWPWYIAETKEGDIWVSDYTEECIIVINKKNEPKFKYNGPTHIKMDKQFYPRGMISNRLGQVVVIDRGNEAVHLVDKDGHFVKFILTKDDGINGPYSLSQDTEGTIWVGCASRRIVIVAKYLKP